jgi:rhomboid protease GluP
MVYLRTTAPEKMPRATLCILLVTGVLTGLQYIFPSILTAMQRTPSALAQYQWWRLVTPLWVQSGGWCAILFVFPSFLIVGTLAEKLWGTRRWFILYFAGGLTGQIAGYAWQPYGSGASVAGAGLAGSLALWLLYRCHTPPARFGGCLILLGAVVLTFLRDLHGPPILVGALLAFALCKADDASLQRVPAEDHS